MLSFADSLFEFQWLRSSLRFSLRSLCRRPIFKCTPYCLCKKSPYFINQQVITLQSFCDLISPHRKNALKCILLYFSKLKFHWMRRTFPVRFRRVFILFRVGHLILRALTFQASDPKNALARTSFHSPKSLPPTPASYQPFSFSVSSQQFFFQLIQRAHF